MAFIECIFRKFHKLFPKGFGLLPVCTSGNHAVNEFWLVFHKFFCFFLAHESSDVISFSEGHACKLHQFHDLFLVNRIAISRPKDAFKFRNNVFCLYVTRFHLGNWCNVLHWAWPADCIDHNQVCKCVWFDLVDNLLHEV